MSTTPTLAFQISRDFCGLYCKLHHSGLSSRKSKDYTVVRICCNYFKDEVEEALQKQFGMHFVSENVRFQLPAVQIAGIISGDATAED